MSRLLEKNTKKLSEILPAIHGFFHNITIKVSKVEEIPIAQYRVLVILSKLGDVTVNELKEHLGIAQSSASGIIERLEKSKLVKKVDNPADRRQTLIRLTKKATKKIETRYTAMNEVYTSLLQSLSAEDQEELISSYEKIDKIINKIIINTKSK
ncbi:MAG: MarR family transcriptional regulator [Ignavibacteriaceae bacterium]|jgi:DNA-binding MarR family transcriptional regulator|nr:MarR family transcriptional regulator [Ignavibacteriaceae bacterium]